MDSNVNDGDENDENTVVQETYKALLDLDNMVVVGQVDIKKLPITNHTNTKWHPAPAGVSLGCGLCTLQETPDGSSHLMRIIAKSTNLESGVASGSKETDTRLNCNHGSEDDSSTDDNDLDLGDCPTMFPPFHARYQLVSSDESGTESESGDAESETQTKTNFEWKNLSFEPISTIVRGEFSVTETGPTEVLNTPYEAFVAIWTSDFMEHIVNETNKYAHQVLEKQETRVEWVDTNIDELYVYFMLLISMGIAGVDDLSRYWRTVSWMPGPPIFARSMTLDRFCSLSQNLHFNDNSNVLNVSQSEAKIYKILPVVEHLNERFERLYRIGRDIVVEESLTEWKTKREVYKYYKNKAAAVGIKTLEVCELETGYMWRLKVFSGSEDTYDFTSPKFGMKPYIILDLLKGLEGKGYTVWMSNYHSNPSLARSLKSHGFDCVGPMRNKLKKHLPPSLAGMKKSKIKRSQIFGCSSGDVNVVMWRDRWNILETMLSTYHVGTTVTKNHSTPAVVSDYNKIQNLIEKKEEMLSNNPMERKHTKFWYKKLFRRLLNVSVLNAFILYKRSSADSRLKVSDHQKFRMDLAKAIFDRHRLVMDKENKRPRRR